MVAVTDLREYARNQPCQVRLPGVCNFDPRTTVLAHFRLVGVTCFAKKHRHRDLIAAWACSKCHEYIDTHHDDATQLAFLLAVVRTQNFLLEDGIV